MVRSRLLLAVVAAALAVVSAAAPGPARAAQQEDAPRRTLVITAPALTWQHVRDARPPNLLRLLDRAAVASMSVRTIGPRTTAVEGYLTIGAGNRATGDELVGGLGFDRDEPFDGRPASATHRVRTGTARSTDVVHVSAPELAARNRALNYGAVPGTLGQTLREEGRSVAVVGNADTSRRPQLKSFHREVALGGMDLLGHVDGGRVGHDLLLEDDDAPFGLRLDPAQVDAALDDALDDHDVVLLELSDLERADLHALVAAPAQAARLRAAALEASDELIGLALEKVDLERDQVVLTTVSSSRTGPEHLGVAAFAGLGFEPGLARSGTTRRSGYVTLPDLGPTILERFGITVPVEMTGAPVSVGSGARLDLERMVQADERATFRDRVHGPTSVTFIVVQVAAYGAALLAVRRRGRRLRAAVGTVALVTLAVAPVAFLLGLADLAGLSTLQFLLVLYGCAAAVAAVAWAALRRWTWAPPVAVLALLLVVLLVDVVTGGYLQLDTVFGYSPIVAGRFAGYGNLAFALLAASTLVVGTVVGAAAPASTRVRLLLAGAVFAAAIVVDGTPSWGSDVGGVLAMVPGFVAALALLSGSTWSWKRFLASGAAAGAAVAVFALIDLSRPASSQTHLGRLARRVVEGEGVATIIERKALANLSLLTSSVWTFILPAAFAFLGYLIWRPPRPLPELQARTPGLRACLVAAAVVGALGFALNDSGVAVPAMMLAVLLPYLAHLLVAEDIGTTAATSDGPRRR